MSSDAAPIDDNAICRAIARRVDELLTLAAPLCARHRCAVPRPRLRFDLRGLSAGQALWQPGRAPTLRFNLELARTHRHDFLQQTVPHEVAHLLTAACFGRVPPHGEAWRETMRWLGVPNPSRCHRYDACPTRRQRRWAYVCDCSDHAVSTTRHNRMRNGSSYLCRRCGSPLRLRPAGHDD